ncbi:MFS transporter [Sodalis sp. RH15]|uniref:MFS transporter n=1 Tax=Sodalis sp. RH15 TaxID=3394330 RepID=UPI0039B479C5
MSDRLGRKKLLILGCLLAIIGYASIALSESVFLFASGLLLTGISFPWIDAPSRALMSDLLQDQKRRELALQIRYLMVNIAADSGSLIGIICYLVYAQKDSVVSQYLLALDAVRAVELVTVMLVINAITVLVAQLYLTVVGKYVTRATHYNWGADFRNFPALVLVQRYNESTMVGERRVFFMALLCLYIAALIVINKKRIRFRLEE